MTKNRKIGAVILAATTVNILVAMAYGFSTYGCGCRGFDEPFGWCG